MQLVFCLRHQPCKVHWTGALRVLQFLKGAPGKGLIYRNYGRVDIIAYSDSGYAGDRGDRKSTSGYCTYVGGNLVTWRSKKQGVVCRSSAEAEYRAMTHTACEMMWIQSFLSELGFPCKTPMNMLCDNQAAIHIASNPVFHERTKHIEVDCHYVRDLVMKGVIAPYHVSSRDELADLFTKGFDVGDFTYLCNKLGMLDIYAPT